MKKLLLFLLLITASLTAQDVFQLESTRQVSNDIATQRLTYGSFNGIDNRVAVADNDNLDFGVNDFSVILHLKKSSLTTTWQDIINKSNNQYSTITSGWNIAFRTDLNQIIFRYLTNNYKEFSFSNSSNLELLVMVTDRVNELIEVYVNGTKLGNISGITGFDTLNLNSSFGLSIGATNTNNRFSNATIISTRLYNRRLTSSDNSAIWNNGRPDLYKTPFSDIGAKQLNVASGSLVNGKTYIVVKNGTADTSKITYGGARYGKGQTFTATSTATYTEDAADSTSLYQAGVIADYRFDEGSGYQVKDYSGNELHGTLFGTNYPTGYGYSTFWQNPPQFFTQRFNYADESISSSAATTTLFRMPPKVGNIKMIIAVDTAGASTDTFFIKDASGNIMATVGGLNTTGSREITFNNTYAVAVLNEKQLYIQKNQATTTGYYRFFFRFESLTGGNW